MDYDATLVDDAVAGFNDAARETDRFDSLPFDHQFGSDDDDSLNEYYDAMVGGDKFDDDDDEVVLVRDAI
jgi:hypothetical protein